MDGKNEYANEIIIFGGERSINNRRNGERMKKP